MNSRHAYHWVAGVLSLPCLLSAILGVGGLATAQESEAVFTSYTVLGGGSLIGRHSGSVSALLFGPGEHLIMADGIGEVRRFSMDFAQEQVVFGLLQRSPEADWWQSTVSDIVVDKDGNILAVRPYNGHLQKSGVLTAQELPRQYRGGDIGALAANGRIVALAPPNVGLVVIELESMRRLSEFSVPRQIQGLRFSPLSRLLCVCSSDMQVDMFDVSTATRIWSRSLQGSTGSSWVGTVGLAFDPLEARVACASSDGIVELQTRDGVSLREVAKGDVPRAVTYSADGDALVYGTRAGRVGFVTRKGVELRQVSQRGAVLALAAAGKFIASAGHDGCVSLWTCEGALVGPLGSGHAGQIRAMAVTPDWGEMLTVGSDQRVLLWSVPGGTHSDLLAVGRGEAGEVMAAALSDDRALRALALADGRILLQSAGATDWLTLHQCDPEFPGTALAFLGSRLLVADAHGEVWLQDPSLRADGKPIARALPDDVVACFSCSRDGGVHATGLVRGERLRIGRGGSDVWTTIGSGIASCALSDDGRLVAVGGEDWSVHVLNSTSGARRWRLSGHHDVVTALAFDRSAGLLASGSQDRDIRIWRILDGTLLGVLRGHRATLRGLSFASSGEKLISAGDDGQVLIWDIKGVRSR